MYLPETYGGAILMMFITMVCLGLLGQHDKNRQDLAFRAVLLGLCDGCILDELDLWVDFKVFWKHRNGIFT